ncbi:MAG: bifunctional phosphoribosylaminoimidazolecarboxamide formyltransferase/IMP cyclohydrolase [Armatimonadetes bacterium]|nr:bifunctional phosphoribosylaminoimidazolecarboxamide formyltransferase/IMP cyclohydrolase [Armatimonadota bacterium]
MARIARALVSVSDKTGVVEFARGLAEMGVEILSTGGTARTLTEAGIEVTPVEAYTGFPEMLDGRVKTLHPKVHGALLGLRDNPEHVAKMQEHGIIPIDLVAVNLYPFRETVARPDVTLEEAVENIDIGGPAMLRSAAKNFRFVTVVCNPARYPDILAEMRTSGGEVSEQTRRLLALEAFQHTARYDAAISAWLARQFLSPEGLPPLIVPWLEKIQDLRYGENPHQAGAFYRLVGAAETGLAGAVQLHGKELSFNNILDLASALEAARDFDEPTAVIVKHLNPCGLASAPTLRQAFEDAWATDPLAAFGGVVGLNRVVDRETAEVFADNDYLAEVILPRYRQESGDEEATVLAAFVEAVIAPGYEPEALEILREKKNLRIMALEDWRGGRGEDLEFRSVPGGALVQTPDLRFAEPKELRVVTRKQPTAEQMEALLFADRVSKHVKSNAIVLCQGKRLVGCGAGQMSRIDSMLIAARKAGRRAAGSVLASDAMFPARDNVDAAAQTGCVAIIQPGGSIRDDEVIAAADEHGLAMVFTGLRHFWH